jgi:hypothetical protein
MRKYRIPWFEILVAIIVGGGCMLCGWQSGKKEHKQMMVEQVDPNIFPEK